MYAWGMQSIETTAYSSLEVMAPATQRELTTLIRLGKLSTEDIADYNGWLLAHNPGEALVGCVGVELRSPHAYMESLVVHPDMRRQGLGAELTERLFGLYIADNADTSDLTAMTLFWNNKFYESLGFERVDPRAAKIADDVATKEKHKYCTVWRLS